MHRSREGFSLPKFEIPNYNTCQQNQKKTKYVRVSREHLAKTRRSRDRRWRLASRNGETEPALSVLFHKAFGGTKRWPLVDRCGFAWLTRISPWRTCTPRNWDGARPVYAVIIMGRGSSREGKAQLNANFFEQPDSASRVVVGF